MIATTGIARRPAVRGDDDQAEAVADAVGDRVEQLAERAAAVEQLRDQAVDLVEHAADQDEQRRPLVMAVVDRPERTAAASGSATR